MSFSFCLTLQLIKSPTHSEPIFRVSLSLTFFYGWGFRACQNLWREVTWIQPGPQKSGSDTLTARLLLTPHHNQRPVPLPQHKSAPASLQPQRVSSSTRFGLCQKGADLCNVAGLRNLRAPVRVINLENLTQGTVQPDASQPISLTNLRLQWNPGGPIWFQGGGENKGRRGAGISKFCSWWI